MSWSICNHDTSSRQVLTRMMFVNSPNGCLMPSLRFCKSVTGISCILPPPKKIISGERRSKGVEPSLSIQRSRNVPLRKARRLNPQRDSWFGVFNYGRDPVSTSCIDVFCDKDGHAVSVFVLISLWAEFKRRHRYKLLILWKYMSLQIY